MRCLLLAICLFFLAPAMAGASSLKLAYVKHGWLYTLQITRAGVPVKGAKPVRIRPVPAYLTKLAATEGSKVSLVGSPDGRYVALSVFTDVQVISLATHKVVHWPDPAVNPSFSPDGNQLAYDTGNDPPDTRILDLASGRVRTLRKNAFDPFWCANGKEIACLEFGEYPNNGYALILNAKTGKVDFWTDTPIFPEDLILSPSGRYLAILTHLAGLQMDYEITDRLSKYEPAEDLETGEDAPPPGLDAWSPNDKWLLWEWRFTDPKNDGSWLWQDVGLTSFSGRTKRKIGMGLDGSFAPDSRYVLWLEPRRREDYYKPPYDLMWRPFRGKARRLVAAVDAYTLVGAYSASRWQ